MAWIKIKQDSAGGEEYRRMLFMIDAADISTPPDPDNSAPGSVAFTADMTGVWMKDGTGQWTESTTDALHIID